MLIDCDACGVRGTGCAECVMTLLIGAPPVGVELAALPAGVEWDEVERAALGALAAAGLDPQLLAVTGAADDPDQVQPAYAPAYAPAAHRARRRAG